MHHLADSMTELCHIGKHNNASGESIPMYYISGEEAKLVVIGRGRYLSVCHGGMNLDSLRFGISYSVSGHI